MVDVIERGGENKKVGFLAKNSYLHLYGIVSFLELYCFIVHG